MPLLPILPLYAASGFLVGLLVGLTGVGGGSLMTPILVLLFGIHPATAIGTDLIFASATKSAGTLVHRLNDTVDWGVVRRLATGSIPASLLTIATLHIAGPKAAGSPLISSLLGCALILTAISLLCRTRIRALAARRGGFPPGRQVVLTIVIGAALGALVTLSSVGAGALGVTALTILYPALPIARIVGSDIAHAVPLTLLAGLGHWLLGEVDWWLLGALLLGSLPGIALGSHVAARVPEALLRAILAAALAVAGSRLAL